MDKISIRGVVMKKCISLILIVVFISAFLCGCGGFSSKEVEAVILSKTELALTIGETGELEVSFEPKKAQEDVSWSSENENIATVEDGKVTAVSIGTTDIIAETASGKSAKCTVTVSNVKVTGITLSSTDIQIDVGETTQITATVTPEDAPVGNLEWESSDTSVATVNTQGYITGVADGQAQITCSDAGVEAVCHVTVGEGATTAPTTAPTVPETTAPPATEPATTAPVVTDPPVVDTDTDTNSGTAGDSYDSGDFVFPESSTSYLTDSRISDRIASATLYSPTGDYAQDAINEIYARNGYEFQNKYVRSHYEGMSWYTPGGFGGFNSLNAYEKYNLKLLSEYI